ncbi:MAG: dethiobiotin synthase [Elainellaceae cyanobacterium]
MNALLIAGTDLGVGKTVLTTALAAYWQRYCGTQRLGVMKLVQCGTGHAVPEYPGGDRDLFTHLSQGQSPEQTNPLYFQSALIPPIAARQENRYVELDQAWQQFEQLSQQRDFILMEAGGGLGTPITNGTTIADLAWDWRLPVVLVVPIIPGAIAHAISNVALAQRSRVYLKGIVLNEMRPCHAQEREQWADSQLIESFTNVRVLGSIPHLANPLDLSKLAQVASNLDLERLIPLS